MNPLKRSPVSRLSRSGNGLFDHLGYAMSIRGRAPSTCSASQDEMGSSPRRSEEDRRQALGFDVQGAEPSVSNLVGCLGSGDARKRTRPTGCLYLYGEDGLVRSTKQPIGQHRRPSECILVEMGTSDVCRIARLPGRTAAYDEKELPSASWVMPQLAIGICRHTKTSCRSPCTSPLRQNIEMAIAEMSTRGVTKDAGIHA
jgi:hypothetical protein